MTKVNCFLEKCVYCKDYTCARDEITLDDEHSCIGGCDDGWEFQPEEENEAEEDNNKS